MAQDKIFIEIEDALTADRKCIKGIEVKSTSTVTSNSKTVIQTEQTVFTATDGTNYTITIERSKASKK